MYMLSFLLTAAWDSKPPADPVSGWFSAGFTLGVTRDLLQSGWPTDSWIFQHRQFEFFALLVSGWINILFIISVFIVVLNLARRAFVGLRAIVIALMPFCSIVFSYERMYPREGYFLWTLGMLAVLFSDRLANLRKVPAIYGESYDSALTKKAAG
jgi:hypothetical protein